MPKESKPAIVELSPLPAAPTWDELKANPEFLKWHKSPFLRLMTAALRVAVPMSGAIDPHSMIRDGGIAQGHMITLLMVDDFCNTKEQQGEKPKIPPYSHDNRKKIDPCI
jgi:hypothetical protein